MAQSANKQGGKKLQAIYLLGGASLAIFRLDWCRYSLLRWSLLTTARSVDVREQKKWLPDTDRGWSSGLGVVLRQKHISIGNIYKKLRKSTNWLGIGYEKMFCDCNNEILFFT
jgi:hypothetical protein